MKKILFITSDSTYRAFDYTIESLNKEYKCLVVDSLAKALKVLESGVDKIVMYPFYIKYYDYSLNTNQDARIFAGYRFWIQEVMPKAIPIIVVNLQLQWHDLIHQIKLTGWQNEKNVTFFEHDGKPETKEELLKLIKA